MKENRTFTVLESAITISGKLRVFLNTFDIEIPVGSTLLDASGNEWTITGSSKEMNKTSNTEIKKKIMELGAVLYHIESIIHKLPKVGDLLLVK